MRKPVIDVVVVMAAVLLWAQNVPAGGQFPDGGATSLLFAGGLAGLAMVRKFMR